MTLSLKGDCPHNSNIYEYLLDSFSPENSKPFAPYNLDSTSYLPKNISFHTWRKYFFRFDQINKIQGVFRITITETLPITAPCPPHDDPDACNIKSTITFSFPHDIQLWRDGIHLLSPSVNIFPPSLGEKNWLPHFEKGGSSIAPRFGTTKEYAIGLHNYKGVCKQNNLVETLGKCDLVTITVKYTREGIFIKMRTNTEKKPEIQISSR